MKCVHRIGISETDDRVAALEAFANVLTALRELHPENTMDKMYFLLQLYKLL